MADQDGLRHGPLGDGCAYLCVDMQNIFAGDTERHTPWMRRVLPFVERLAEAKGAVELLLAQAYVRGFVIAVGLALAVYYLVSG